VYRQDRLIVAGGLMRDGVFGPGEENETTLLKGDERWFIASYNLDGTLDFAHYLEVPESFGQIRLTTAKDGSLIAVFNHDNPSNPEDSKMHALVKICL
jgi:hypothetical protein